MYLPYWLVGWPDKLGHDWPDYLGQDQELVLDGKT